MVSRKGERWLERVASGTDEGIILRLAAFAAKFLRSSRYAWAPLIGAVERVLIPTLFAFALNF